MSDTLVFEQPLNEHTRLCLRIEHLCAQAKANLPADTQWRSRMALTSITEMLNVVDRPDIKSKLITALNKQSNRLSQLVDNPHVDPSKLQTIIIQLEDQVDTLYADQTKIAHKLRENEFLKTLRHRAHSPGGLCNFTLPPLQLWLQQAAEQKSEILSRWLDEFSQIEQTTTLLLSLIRENCTITNENATNGFYQQTLDVSHNNELIRVILPLQTKVYPSISVGRQRLSIHFNAFKTSSYDEKYAIEDIFPFELGFAK